MRSSISVFLTTALVAASCGAEEQPHDAQETRTREENVVTLDSLRYRVVKFRQLNPRSQLDRKLYRGPLPDPNAGVYAAFIQICNVGRTAATPTQEIALRTDTKGRIKPLDRKADNPFAYRRVLLHPGQCAPRDGTVVEPLSGLVLPFAVSFSEADDLPLELEVADGGERVRLEVKA